MVIEMGTGMGVRRGWRWGQKKAGNGDRGGIRDKAWDRDGIKDT